MSEPDLHLIRRRVEQAGRLSDGLVRIGPISLGLEAVLDWIPGLGEAYGIGAGAYIVGQGIRAGVPAPTLALAAALMLGRTAISAVPLAGPLAADLLTTHRFAARLICAAIDRKLMGQARPASPRWRTNRTPVGRGLTPSPTR